ncbi:class I SAM-dependent methyltransferase [Nocardia sp. NPDC057030]|uniref:class I SAM-dependent methyltransferase n=1 Tax=unclassified Nocardia TaxID=2637762 RepID=UPI003641CFAD
MTTRHDTHAPDDHRHTDGADPTMVRLLELDARVLAPHLTELTGWLADLLAPAPARILDLGSGPGTGSFALARRFPAAAVTAADLSAQMLHRLREQANAHGLADRIDTVHTDLDQPWPRTMNGPYDLVWAASYLHHAADPARTLTQAFERLRPGGLLAVTEMDFFPRLLPEDSGLGRPGLQTRLHAATNTQPPHDWTAALTNAGFTLEQHRRVDLRLDRADTGPALNDYARTFLTVLRSHAESILSDDDLTALDALLDDDGPDGLTHRTDLNMQTTRIIWIARRP